MLGDELVVHGYIDLAIADYSTALRYAPDYEPSRAALLRLTGNASANTPSSEAEQQAGFLAEKASQAARRGDYETALTLLDHAESMAPQYSLVFQYRSNVAYLEGDIETAIAATRAATKSLSPPLMSFNRMSNSANPTKCIMFSNRGGMRRRITISGRVRRMRPPSSAGMGSRLKIPNDMVMIMKNHNGFWICW